MELSIQCSQCGASVAREAVFCQQCGGRIGEPGERAGDEHPRSGGAALLDQKIGRDGSRSLPAEEELWQGGYSGKALLGQWIAAGVLSIACLGLLAMYSQYWLYLLAGLGVIWVIAAARYFFHRLDVRYRLTTHRFYHQHGVLSRTTERIEVIDMDDITFTQGPIQRLLGVGTLKITSSDRTHPELFLYGIDDVQTVAEQMDDARRDERARRGVHIESI